MHAVHLVFHISTLEPAVPNTILNCKQLPPPPVIIDGEPEYDISEILESKLNKQYRCKLQYLVKWLGYENTDEERWISTTELNHAADLVTDFHKSYPDKPGPASAS
jgi:Chromo (CHRromatin Organisation MOdifier) domain